MLTPSAQRLVIAAVVAVSVAAGALVLPLGDGSAAPGRAPEPSIIRVFTPFPSGRLASRFRIVKTVRGSCFFGSPAAKRPDAWRCEPFVLDPCFENRANPQRYVFCIPTPWSAKVTRIRLTKALPVGDRARERKALPARRGRAARDRGPLLPLSVWPWRRCGRHQAQPEVRDMDDSLRR